MLYYDNFTHTNLKFQFFAQSDYTVSLRIVKALNRAWASQQI